jgi:hypothetical protein
MKVVTQILQVIFSNLQMNLCVATWNTLYTCGIKTISCTKCTLQSHEVGSTCKYAATMTSSSGSTVIVFMSRVTHYSLY